jgi:hypothetical protein
VISIGFVDLPLLQKHTTQGFQVIQDSAASGHVVTQFRKGVRDKVEGFLLAFRAIAFRPYDVRIHIAPRFLNGFDQQFHKLVRAFDVVKWSLRLEAQRCSFWGIPVLNKHPPLSTPSD